MKDTDAPPEPASRYHHGDLRNALLQAAAAEIEEAGPEAFSLRKVARRAGVSHAAPAHHFGDARGLLTALSAEGYRQFLHSMEQESAIGTSPEERILRAGVGYIRFANENPALFRLMFASDKPDKDDAVLCRDANASFTFIVGLVGAFVGKDPFEHPDAMEDTLTVWSTTHGIADLLSSGRLLPLQSLHGADREAAAMAMIRRSLNRPK